MSRLPPTIAELSRGFGVLLPKSYETLWKVAHEIFPDDPANAFEPIGLQCLGLVERIEESYDTPPEFFTFGWTGCDSSRYGFIVDDINHPLDEYPIAHSKPESQVEASSVAEFIERLIAEELAPPEPTGVIFDVPWLGPSVPPSSKASLDPTVWEKKHIEEVRHIWDALQPALDLRVCSDPEETVENAWQDRLRAGAIPTEDRIGAVVPADTVDREYLGSLQWTGERSWTPLPADETLLDEAERRLTADEPGTALVIARNFRFLHWYDDWKSGRKYVRRTCEIMSSAYMDLGRAFLAERVKRQTETVLANVL